jgi:hypothetical protein
MDVALIIPRWMIFSPSIMLFCLLVETWMEHELHPLEPRDALGLLSIVASAGPSGARLAVGAVMRVALRHGLRDRRPLLDDGVMKPVTRIAARCR